MVKRSDPFRKICLLSLVLALVFTGAFAQDTGAEPFRVGVVLSGGGAKGYAHVGVLKVLEEAGIRVDYIAGTSMGAIVGGLYAAGWSAEQLDSIVQELDILEVIQEVPDRRQTPFIQKQYGEHYALSLSVKDFKVSLPPGFSNGQFVYNYFTRLTDRVHYIRDFRQLPIPFFCIATDMLTGSEVLLEEGFLPLALRASGSLPGLLSPVEVDGCLLADGGIVNNFPVLEMKERGVDLVIGVSVQNEPFTEAELRTVTNILGQISSFQMNKKVDEQKQLCDILIEPSVKGFSVVSFDATDTLVSNGELAARMQWEALKEVARRQREGAAVQSAPLPPRNTTWDVGLVTIEDAKVLSSATILGSFPAKLPGRITEEQFFQGIRNLYSKGPFQFIDYSIDRDEEYGVHIHMDPRPKFGYDRQLRAAVHFDQVYQSSLLVNFTGLNLGVKNSLTSLDLILGDNSRYRLLYHLDRGRAPAFGFISRLHQNDVGFDLPEPLQVDSNLILERVNFNFFDLSNSLYSHLHHGQNHAAGISGEIKYFRSSTDQLAASSNLGPFTNSDGFYLVASGFFDFDNLNDRHFPTNGNLVRLRARFIFPLTENTFLVQRRPDYNFDLHFRSAISMHPKVALGISGDVGISLGSEVLPYFYLLGGYNQNLINNFKPFIGLPFAKVAGTDLLKVSIYGQYSPFKNHFITLGGNLAYLQDAFDPFEEQRLNFFSVGLRYSVDTPFGPVELTYGKSNRGSQVYFNLGYWF